MKRYELRGSDQKRLAQDPGGLSETLVGQEYENYSTFGVSNFDVSTDAGKLGEVKSTATELSNGQKGRFRLWKDQHTQLTRADRQGTARYVFVLYDVSTRLVSARMVEKKPANVGNIVAARGGFYDSGHESQGKQYKLPIDAIF